MATVPTENAVISATTGTPAGDRKRRSTSHLKGVPETKALRTHLRARCYEVASRLNKDNPLTKDEMERVARDLLAQEGQPEGFVGWTMVMLANGFWQDQVAGVPFERRLMLLPHCLKHAEGCPADYDSYGLDCRKCGACSIADFRANSEDLGYKVLVAEGSPIVMKIIVSGYVDAIVGVACLNVLEKAIDKILMAGIPCLAVPLLSSDCRNTSVDEDWVAEMINLRPQAPAAKTKSYLHLMRAASNLFEPQQMDRLIPRARAKTRLAEVNGQGLAAFEPIAATEAIAYDFLSKGGKYSRPFITLAVYDALTGGNASLATGDQVLASWPDHIYRAAMSIETFHKASLVHDDIEDNDQYRYGDFTVHNRFGIPTAINVGDYLIGMGYRLISRDAAALGPNCAAEIVDRLADAHLRLAEGQGAELVWRDSRDKRLSALDALKVYALKTAPAFEAALMVGASLAGKLADHQEAFSQFARNLGVAFQILNDLGDWQGDDHNKLSAAGDVLGGRPTVLWALALEGLDDAGRSELLSLAGSADTVKNALPRIRQLYTQAGAFEKASRIVEKYRERAEAIADETQPEELRRLLYYLVDSVLDHKEESPNLPLVQIGLQMPATNGKHA